MNFVTYLRLLQEKRKRGNPNRLAPVNILEKYKDWDNTFVSFTANLKPEKDKSKRNYPKIGLNPQSGYSTPIGIYCYPLKPYWNTIKDYHGIPFRREQPNVFVFTPKRNDRVAYASRYSEEDLKRDREKLRDIFSIHFAEKKIDLDKLEQNLDANFLRSGPAQYISIFWSLTRQIATELLYHFPTKKVPILWTKIMLEFYDGIVDDVHSGFIHTNEPTQAVFFGSNVLKIEELITRVNQEWQTREKKLPKNIERFFNPPHVITNEALLKHLIGSDASRSARYVVGLLSLNKLKTVPMYIWDTICDNAVNTSNTIYGIRNALNGSSYGYPKNIEIDVSILMKLFKAAINNGAPKIGDLTGLISDIGKTFPEVLPFNDSIVTHIKQSDNVKMISDYLVSLINKGEYNEELLDIVVVKLLNGGGDSHSLSEYELADIANTVLNNLIANKMPFNEDLMDIVSEKSIYAEQQLASYFSEMVRHKKHIPLILKNTVLYNAEAVKYIFTSVFLEQSYEGELPQEYVNDLMPLLKNNVNLLSYCIENNILNSPRFPKEYAEKYSNHPLVIRHILVTPMHDFISYGDMPDLSGYLNVLGKGKQLIEKINELENNTFYKVFLYALLNASKASFQDILDISHFPNDWFKNCNILDMYKINPVDNSLDSTYIIDSSNDNMKLLVKAVLDGMYGETDIIIPLVENIAKIPETNTALCNSIQVNIFSAHGWKTQDVLTNEDVFDRVVDILLNGEFVSDEYFLDNFGFSKDKFISTIKKERDNFKLYKRIMDKFSKTILINTKWNDEDLIDLMKVAKTRGSIFTPTSATLKSNSIDVDIFTYNILRLMQLNIEQGNHYYEFIINFFTSIIRRGGFNPKLFKEGLELFPKESFYASTVDNMVMGLTSNDKVDDQTSAYQYLYDIVSASDKQYNTQVISSYLEMYGTYTTKKDFVNIILNNMEEDNYTTALHKLKIQGITSDVSTILKFADNTDQLYTYLYNIYTALKVKTYKIPFELDPYIRKLSPNHIQNLFIQFYSYDSPSRSYPDKNYIFLWLALYNLLTDTWIGISYEIMEAFVSYGAHFTYDEIPEKIRALLPTEENFKYRKIIFSRVKTMEKNWGIDAVKQIFASDIPLYPHYFSGLNLNTNTTQQENYKYKKMNITNFKTFFENFGDKIEQKVVAQKAASTTTPNVTPVQEEVQDLNGESINQIKDQDKVFQIFEQEYLESTGKSWNKDKFLSRAAGWNFYGNSNGFVTIRKQNSGFVKLVGAAGAAKSKYIGFKKILDLKLPVWGLVSKEIADLLVKMGFRVPNMVERMALKTAIGKNVFGDANIVEYQKDGGVVIDYPDVGVVTKYFVGSPQYFKKLYSMQDLMKKYM